MKQLFISSLMLCFIGIAFSCKKKKWVEPQAELPPITQEGKHTFGFMFGNEVWTSNFISTGIPKLTASYDQLSTGMQLNLLTYRESPNSSNTVDSFSLKYDNSTISVGAFQLTNANCKIIASVKTGNNTSKEYQLNNTGSITFLRWDLTNKIASGTFSFSLREVTTGEIVAATEGRFDLKLTN